MTSAPSNLIDHRIVGPGGPTCQRACLGAQSAPSAAAAAERASALAYLASSSPDLMAAYYDGKAPLLSLLALLNWAGLARLSLLAEDGGGAIERRKAEGPGATEKVRIFLSLLFRSHSLEGSSASGCRWRLTNDGRTDVRSSLQPPIILALALNRQAKHLCSFRGEELIDQMVGSKGDDECGCPRLSYPN